MKFNTIYFLMSLLVLGACTTVPEIKIVRVGVPDALLSCMDAPVIPVNPSGRELATFIVNDHEAGADCRDKLSRVKAFQNDEIQTGIDTK